ncbi:MAG: right-handed parallel beta-helix repeat-containing protein, partial [Planctomycetota bacterium]
GFGGSTVYVRAGVYNELVWIGQKFGRSPEKVFTLQNYPGERPVIDRNYTDQLAIHIASNYVTVKGFEIRNLKDDPTRRWASGAIEIEDGFHHIAIEENLIHHVIGGRHTARGIAVSEGAHDILIRNNTVHHITGHPESMGIQADGATAVTIRRNLVYLVDKEGIRLITQDTDTENFVEENITLHCHMGIAINNCRTDKAIRVRNNFSGWNWGRGINPKHTLNCVVEHNTLIGNGDWGYDSHGSGSLKNDVVYLTLKNNLFSRNRVEWWLDEREVLYETVDSNFYHHTGSEPLALFNWSAADECHTLKDIQEKTKDKGALNGPYETNGKEGDPGFVAPEQGDYRLKPDAAARGVGDDGKEAGAIEGALVEVGADRAWSLRNIPDLGWLPMTVESFSSETEQGPAGNVADGLKTTYWEIDAAKDAQREIVLALPGEKPTPLTEIVLVKYRGDDTYFYNDFAVYADDGSGTWKEIPAPPAHPFRGYGGLHNGEIWSLPEGTLARRIKVNILSGFGDTIRIPGIRLYNRTVEA